MTAKGPVDVQTYSGMVWYGRRYGVKPVSNQASKAQIKLEPTVATCGCVDGSIPMVWYKVVSADVRVCARGPWHR